MALIKCPECSHSVSSHATHCPNCGCPIEAIKSETRSIQISKLKNSFHIIIPMIAGVLCLILLYNIGHQLSHQGYYNHHKWGTSFETFQKAYPEDATSKSNQNGDSFFRMEHTFEGISNLDIIEDYKFDNKQLYSVNVTLYPSSTSPISSRQLAKDIVTKYNHYYGDAEYTETLHLRIYKWHTSKSDITLYASSLVMIDYKNSNHTDISETQA